MILHTDELGGWMKGWGVPHLEQPNEWDRFVISCEWHLAAMRVFEVPSTDGRCDLRVTE